MALGCVLTLTRSDNPIEIHEAFKSFRRIKSVDGIPPDDDALTLYIVGHALPDELIDATGEVIPESQLAPQIRGPRDGKPTLIIWDVCYAKSFKNIEGVDFDGWPPNYVHIFSCQAHERTWVGTSKSGLEYGGASRGRAPRISYFSQKLAAALPQHRTWKGLEEELRRQFGRLQTPEIVARYPCAVADFRVS